jgi:hypothetical protein
VSFNLATMLRESARARPGEAVARAGDRDLGYAELDACPAGWRPTCWRPG